MIDLATADIKYLPGVGPQRAATLNKELGICTLHDLLYYFPYKYVDRSRIYSIREIDGTMPYIQLKGEIRSFEIAGEGRQRRLIAHFTDGTGFVDLVWFQGIKFLTGKYKVHQEYVVFGRPTAFNGRINIAHPDIDAVSDVQMSGMGLRPYYNTTEKMKRAFLNSNAIEKMMATLVRQIQEPLPETLTASLLQEHHLMPLTEALCNIHFPGNADLLRKAQYRLKFEELFYVQLNILRYARDRQYKYRGYVFGKVGEVFNTFYTRNLPFELTGAQKRVLKEIRRDLGSGRQMNRLLQGDVGSGKTLVALMSMLIALDNGYQACLMAPTEILANQHFDTIRELLCGMDVRVELLTGSVRGKRREAILKGLVEGDVKILVGTHAVIEDTVNFASLGNVSSIVFNMQSRLLRYTSLIFSTCSSKSYISKNLSAINWSMVEDCRSAPCLMKLYLPKISLEAQTQPIRRPGAKILEHVPKKITSSLVSKDFREGIFSPSNLSSP